ncbi:TusE/DsrC/DsvC family sulfur relay protein [Methylocaldum szegediense]|uniref:Sulfurtransferase n=1 Tax=Methylocaldum szegediense TaxID=73780 RepID=A0ABN8X2G9_9GAMM|nr:TusE/DsrC/DsvC family sulfur relay protein [Methylocaldum szegediense]CAI8777963.1 sulfur transfer protein TusE [Methylocaldum szegediense]
MIEVDGKILETTEGGFLTDANAWDERVAAVLASGVSIELTAAHWEIVRFIRDYYFRFRHLPNTRMFVKAVEKEFGAEKGNSRYLHRLFPESPLKYACLIAGLPKPPGCI